jgi:hypothetical protein
MGQILRSLLKQRSAISSLEFALVAPVFFGLVFVAMQMAMVVLTQAIIEAAARSAARYIETGQAVAGGQPGFQAALCSALSVPPLVNCNADSGAVNSTVHYYIALPPVFNYTIPYLVRPPAQSTYACANPNSPVILQLFYDVPQLIPLMGQLFSINGSFTLGTTVAFYTQNFTGSCS